MITDLALLCILSDDSVYKAIGLIDQNRTGIVLVVDGTMQLMGTVTDGDVRRAMLAGSSLDAPISELLALKAGRSYSAPITATLNATQRELLALMQQHSVRQLPILDVEGAVVGLATMDELLPERNLPMQAVIMAGGFGTRLSPLTDELPKPMLPIGDRPLLEHIVDQLRVSGVHHVNVTTHYMPEKIIEHFGDGQQFGVELNYVEESRPLGTAGALGLMATPSEPLLVINGDILTEIDFRAMYEFHEENQAELTVAVRQYDVNVPYGVIESQGAYVSKLAEKPVYSFFVNAGIYLLEPTVYRFIQHDTHLDMTDLIQRMLDSGCRVTSFPVLEYWLDIGHHHDYEQAQKDMRDGKVNGH